MKLQESTKEMLTELVSECLFEQNVPDTWRVVESKAKSLIDFYEDCYDCKVSCEGEGSAMSLSVYTKPDEETPYMLTQFEVSRNGVSFSEI